MFAQNSRGVKIDHQDDEYLLYNNFGGLLVKKQPKIRHIISGGVAKGYFGRADLGDAVQEVSKVLLEKSEKLKKNFNGLSTVDAYLQSVIYHECCKIARVNGRVAENEIRLDDKMTNLPGKERYILDELAIKDEVKRLEAILNLYPRQKSRLNLFIKMLCRFPVDGIDIGKVYPEMAPAGCAKLATLLNEHPHSTDIELFRRFTAFLADHSSETVLPESLLHYSRDRINEMIALLNKNSKFNSNYDSETFLMLAERFFMMKKNGDPISFNTFFGYIILGLTFFKYL